VTEAGLLLALAAAVVHAAWNLLLAGAEDPEAATAAALPIGAALFLPAVLATWRLEAEAWPYLGASAALEVAYFALLARAYARAEVALVYPLARGSGPVLVVLGSALVLGDAPAAWQWIGVAVVALGVVLVRRGGRPDARAALLALGVGVTIAAYTLVDDRGIRFASPLTYLELVTLLAAVPYLALTVRLRGRAAVARAARSPRSWLAGVGLFGAYALVLAALRVADPGPVAAIRESSVVLAALAAAWIGREWVGPVRLAGCVLVVVGVAVLAGA
jgi:drug/metabolite transporter (DMT)-like permease